MTVPEYQKEKAKVKKYLAEAKGYNKPLRNFTDILDKRKRKTAKNDFDLLHYTVGIISKRLAETNHKMITDVDPNNCDPATLQNSSKTIG